MKEYIVISVSWNGVWMTKHGDLILFKNKKLFAFIFMIYSKFCVLYLCSIFEIVYKIYEKMIFMICIESNNVI